MNNIVSLPPDTDSDDSDNEHVTITVFDDTSIVNNPEIGFWKHLRNICNLSFMRDMLVNFMIFEKMKTIYAKLKKNK